MKNTIKKTTLLAFGALCAFSSQASSIYSKDNTKLDIFGYARALVGNNNISQDSSSYTNTYNDNTSLFDARLGFSGRSQIHDGLDGIMLAVFDTGTRSDTDFKNQYLFVGLDAYEYGSLLLGKGDGAYYTVAGSQDVFSFFQSRANDYYLTGDRLPSQIMYSLSALGFDLRLNYSLRDSRVNDTPFSIKENIGAAISSQFGVITLAYGINYTDFSNKHQEDSATMASFFAPIIQNVYNLDLIDATNYYYKNGPSHKTDMGLALSYGVMGRGYYASLAYTLTDYQHIDHKLYTYEFVNNYSFESGIGITTGYALKTYSGNAIVSDLTLGTYYNVNAAFRLFAEAQISAHAKPESFYGEKTSNYLSQDKYVLGIEYNF